MNTQEVAKWLIETAVFFDTETTGLGADDRVIEIAVVDGKTGDTLVNTLINTPREIDEEAQEIHGISNEMLIGAPSMDMILEDSVAEIMADRPASAFSLDFDRRLIAQSCERHYYNLFEPDKWDQGKAFGARLDVCAMELANRHLIKDHGEWKADEACFKRMSLARCCEIAGVEFTGKAHRALADARATRDLIKKIADGEI